MNNMWLKFRVGAKIAVFLFVTVYLLFFISKNSDQPAKFWYWFFKPDYDTSILVLTLFCFLAGVIVAILVRAMFKTVRQIREVRHKARTERLEREVADMKAKAAMLQTRAAPQQSTSDEIPLA